MHKKCPHCHFYILADKGPFRKTFEEAILLEIERILPLLKEYTIVSIYLGGGTPSLLGPSGIYSLLEKLPILPSQEITLEANPENVTKEQMKQMRAIGINRISLGVQTLDNALLHRIGRGHTADEAISAIENTYEAGIDNISIDLMYDLPNQTVKSWTETLDQVKNLPITHLSLYNLTIEPQTLFYKNKKKLTPQLPSPEKSLAMLFAATERLPAFGLKRYEISAFGRPSRHNTGYWTARPFLGLGPSAFSFWQGKRLRNYCDLKAYSKALKAGTSAIDFIDELSLLERQAELLAIHLRMIDGVNLTAFEELHGTLFPSLAEALNEAITKEWVCPPPQLQLTPKGLLFYDSVAELLIQI